VCVDILRFRYNNIMFIKMLRQEMIILMMYSLIHLWEGFVEILIQCLFNII